MTYEEGIDYFKKNICSFCCGNNCHIATTEDGFKCNNYVKNIDKVNKSVENISKEVKIKTLKLKMRDKKIRGGG